MLTYTGVGLAEASQETKAEGQDTWLSDLQMVLVEPEVVGAVRAQVLLVTVEMEVPHVSTLLIINYNKQTSTQFINFNLILSVPVESLFVSH